MLRAENVDIWRGDTCLLESLDFELAAGQMALAVGPNGAGKTTLLRVLAGLTPPTSGHVAWEGTSVRSLPPEQRGQIAYRGHFDGLKSDLTVDENLQFCRKLWGSATDIGPLLEQLQLERKKHVRVRYLSAGQRRRAALGCLRLCGARLWILDEPTTNLDADGRALVTAWVRAHVESGGLAMIATHQPGELANSGTLLIEL